MVVMLTSSLMLIIQGIRKRLFLGVAIVAVTLSPLLAVLAPSPANAILESAEFSFNDPTSIRGSKFLHASTPTTNDSNFNINFTGTWPNYQSERVSWVACSNKEGAWCEIVDVGTGPVIPCSGVIKLTVTNDEGTQGQLDAEESGLGRTSNDSVDCKAAISERSTITLKNPVSKDSINRAEDKQKRRDALATGIAATCQRIANEQGAPPTAVGACVQRALQAYDTCYNTIGGANGIERNVDIGALATCIETATGLPASDLQAAIAAAPPSNVQPGTPGSGPSTTDQTTSCAIQGVGWIVCPVINFLANLADNAFKWISEWFLVIDTSYYSNTSGTRIAWEAMRTIANIMFVIAFIVIIYSQLTSAGLSNYGIKKLLPRLIAAAILVNASFLICQIAVDISNILGSSVADIFKNISAQILSQGGQSGLAIEQLDLGGIIAGLLIAGAAAYAVLSLAGVVIVAGLVATLLLLLFLIIRKILIILLIALAPIAFVCMLLPNTEDYFKTWRKTFTRLLLVFPIIAMCYGAGLLARAVIQTSSGTPPPNPTSSITSEYKKG